MSIALLLHTCMQAKPQKHVPISIKRAFIFVDFLIFVLIGFLQNGQGIVNDSREKPSGGT